MNCVLSAFADEYSGNFETQLKMLAENGIPMIEPRILDGKNIADLSESEAKEIRKKLDAYGIRVSSIGSPLGKSKLSEAFSRELERTKRVIETADILGTDRIRVFSFYSDGDIHDGFSEVTERLSRMVSEAGKSGITLCHENEAKIFGESPEDCEKLLSAVPGLGCVFDMGNFVLGGYDPRKAYQLLKKRITYFHIKDALYAGAIVPPGRGEARISEILCDFSKNRGVIATLEPHLETFDGFNSLVENGRKFENPYKFESREKTFLTALSYIKEIIG